jgi:mannose-6-phosphate isomerase
MLDPLSDAEFDSLVTRNVFSGGSLRSVLSIKSDGYFRAHLAPQSGEFDAGFAIALVLNGSGEITFANTAALPITQGDAIVIPHAAGTYAISGANVIICRPPLGDLAKTAL